MDLNKLINECLEKSEHPFIKATTVSNYFKSPFNVWADQFAPQEEKDPISEYLELLFKQGIDHEQAVIKSRYPKIKEFQFTTKIDGFKLLIKELSKGTKVFHNMPLYYMKESFLAQPDVLERDDSHDSIFGDYHYIIKEIKLAKNLKKEHVMQAMFANYIIGNIQGYMPKQVFLINKENQEFPVYYQEYEQELLDAIKEIRSILNGKYVSPNIGTVKSPWESYAMKLAMKSKDLSLLNSLGPMKKKILIDNGITNLNELASLRVNNDIGIIKKEHLKKFRMAAKCIINDRHLFLNKVELPIKKTEFFLDFESSTGLEIEEYVGNIDYLIGVLKRENGKEEFIPFIARSIEQEEEMLNSFLYFLSDHKDFVIYHFGAYEITRFNELFEKYGIDEKLRKLVLKNMIDLLKVCKENVIFPMPSYSLKSIAPYLGFNWRLQDINAQQSLVLYLDYIKNNNQEAIEKILIYNEDDVIATRIVKDFLVKNK
jgi:predicted RecB family nuclease